MADVTSEFSQFFKKEDLRGPRVLTITNSERDEIGRGDDRETKRVLYFEEDPRGVVLNKSRFTQLVEITGSADSDQWVGKKITLVVDPNVKYAGKKVGGLAFEAVA